MGYFQVDYISSKPKTYVQVFAKQKDEWTDKCTALHIYVCILVTRIKGNTNSDTDIVDTIIG